MAKEKKSSLGLVGSTMTALVQSILQGFVQTIQDTLQQTTEKILDVIQLKAMQMQKRSLQLLTLFACLLSCAVFLVLALSFYLTDELNLPRYVLFLVLAIILGIASYIISRRQY
ncbi:MAG TPA: hypothetical protein VK158_01330 [Acidobacteriota bacterium]|nr:hypothetical protein [Acidobacteriota bacterium]